MLCLVLYGRCSLYECTPRSQHSFSVKLGLTSVMALWCPCGEMLLSCQPHRVAVGLTGVSI